MIEKSERENAYDFKVILLVILFILIQVLLVTFLKINPKQDELGYLNLYYNTVNNGKMFYPTNLDRYSDFIWAPGFINYLILLFRFIGLSLKGALYVNILINVVILFEIKYIADKLFGSKVSKLAVILYCIYITNYGSSLYLLTELPFSALAYGTICMYLSENKKMLMLSGLMMALANWIRPLSVPFIIAIILIELFKKQKSKKNIAIFFTTFVLSIGIIGISTYKSFGDFVYQSSTSGYNLIMGANDEANGTVNKSVFDKGKIGYISGKKTYKQRNDYWKKQSEIWIKNNPIKYVKLLPKKIIYMYFPDSEFTLNLVGINEYQSFNEVFRAVLKNHLILSDNKILVCFILVAINQIFYFSIFILFIYGCFIMYKSMDKRLYIFLSIFLLGTAVTIITVGGARYHYPYLPVLIIVSSFVVQFKIEKVKIKLGD